MRIKISIFLASIFVLVNLSCENIVKDSNERQSSKEVEITTNYISKASPNDSYLEGYVQALIDELYHKEKVKVVVRNKIAYLYNLPHDQSVTHQITDTVVKVPGILEVKDKPYSKQVEKQHKKYIVPRPQIKGIWFPQNTVLFPPLVADPRAVLNSIMYRWQWGNANQYFGRTAVAVSFGDVFPIYRFIDIGSIHAKIQFGLEAGAWALFRIDHKEDVDWSEFINADYSLGIPITMAVGDWQYRLRFYHTSSHLGDELMVNNPQLNRVNPSYEAIDLFAAYVWKQTLRPNAGIGVIFRTDESYKFKPLYLNYGCEYRFWKRVVHYNRLYGQAFVAANFSNSQTRNWALDSTYVAGYEWSKLKAAGRRFRIFMEIHNGFAPDGQFFLRRLNYFGFRISYGF